MGGHGDWSEPQYAEDAVFRRIGGRSDAFGQVRFSLWFFYPKSNYELDVVYRSPDEPFAIRIDRGEASQTAIFPAGPDWQSAKLDIAFPEEGRDLVHEIEASRWPGVPGLKIEQVQMVDINGQETAVFEVHKPLRVNVRILAEEDGTFPLIPAALVFRLDGIVVTRHVGSRVTLDVSRGDLIEAELDYGPLQLGNGSYLLSVGLYKELENYAIDDVIDLPTITSTGA